MTLEYANLWTIENGMATLNVGFADWQQALEAGRAAGVSDVAENVEGV